MDGCGSEQSYGGGERTSGEVQTWEEPGLVMPVQKLGGGIVETRDSFSDCYESCVLAALEAVSGERPKSMESTVVAFQGTRRHGSSNGGGGEGRRR